MEVIPDSLACQIEEATQTGLRAKLLKSSKLRKRAKTMKSPKGT